MQANPLSVMNTEAEVLLIYPDRSDCGSLTDMLKDAECRFHRVHRVTNCREAVLFLQEHSAGVAISDARLPDGTWRDLLSQILQVPDPPNLIVTSWFANERLWADVLNAGGYDLLLMPFDTDEVTRVMTQAWLDWARKKGAMAKKVSAQDSTVSSGKMVIARKELETASLHTKRKETA